MHEQKKRCVYTEWVFDQGDQKRISKVEGFLHKEIELIKYSDKHAGTDIKGYFDYLKNNNIKVSNVNNSAVAYVIGITDDMPLDFVDRTFGSPPDIDSDFQDDRREEVIAYMRQKYGADHVAQVCKFGTVHAKSAIRDICRVLDMPYSVGDDFVKVLPLELEKRGHVIGLDDILGSEPTMAAIAKNKDFARIFSYVKRIAGIDMVSNVGVNASGVIISDKPISEYCPVFHPPKTDKDGDAILATQWDKIDTEEVGLIKFDILGLKTLTVINKALQLIEKRHGIKLPTDIEQYDLEDQNVYKASHNWDSLSGCFQIETSEGFKMLFNRLKPASINDLSDILALWRPGPMDNGLVEEYIDAKKGKTKPYIHETVSTFMHQTGNVLLFQEQVMAMCRAIAGYTLAESDNIRRIMGKKKPAEMAKLEDEFIPKCINYGLINKEQAKILFDELSSYAQYCFNKSHSAGYALITYWTMWLKHYYPVEFLASQMNTYIDNSESIAKYIKEAKSLGINIVMPSFKHSRYECLTNDNQIIMGLGVIAGIGESVNDFIDYCNSNEVDINDFILLHKLSFGQKKSFGKKNVQALIYAGAFDYIGEHRSKLMATYEFYEQTVAKKYKNKDYSLRLHFMTEAGYLPASEYTLETMAELLEKRQELMPFISYGERLDGFDFIYTKMNLTKINDFLSGQIEYAIIPGIISNIRTKKTAKGIMGWVEIQDAHSGTLVTTVFADTWKKCKDYLVVGNGICVEGKKNVYNENVNLVANQIRLLRDMIANTKR